MNELFVVIILDNSLTAYRVLIFVLNSEGTSVFTLVLLYFIEVKFLGNRIIYRVILCAKIDTASLVSDFLDRNSAVKKLGKGENNALAHSIGQNVCARVYKHGATDFVVPIVVVCKSTKRRLKSAYDNRHIAIRLSYAVTVNYNGTVRALAHFAPRGIVIIRALLLRGGIVRNHTVNVACAYQKAKSRLAKALELLARFVIGLR